MLGRPVLCGLAVLLAAGCSTATAGRASPAFTGPTPAPTSPSTPTSTPVADQTAPPDSNPLDVRELQERWWRWATSEPGATNPVSDTTGEDCARNQDDDLWLVAGSFGRVVERRCTVPARLPLAGPAVSQLVDEPAQCDGFLDAASGRVTVDGRSVPLRGIARAPVHLRAVEGNPVFDGAGDFDGYGCGLWFSVPPLRAGEHVLEISGGFGDFSVRVTYHLTTV